jgi:hypothetical protein
VPRPTILLLALALAGCESAQMVTVRVMIPDLDGRPTPASGVTVTALPFDRDSLASAIERARHAVRPHVAELDSIYDRYRGPFLDYFRASRRQAAVKDSAAKGLLPPAAVEVIDRQVAATRETLDRIRARYDGHLDTLKADVARWEDSTYSDYDSLGRALLQRAGRKVVTDTTDLSGTATLRLVKTPAGWWISASSWDPLDPNRVWYWNVPVRGDTVVLGPETGMRRPR